MKKKSPFFCPLINKRKKERKRKNHTIRAIKVEIHFWSLHKQNNTYTIT